MWRLATVHEDEKIISLCRELNSEDPGPNPVPDKHMKNTLLTLRKEESRGKALVLEVNQIIVGYALLISFWSNELGGEVCNIDELYVEPQYRRNGYSTTLVKALIGKNAFWPRTPVAIELEVTPVNTKAREFYTRLGFHPQKNAQMRLLLR